MKNLLTILLYVYGHVTLGQCLSIDFTLPTDVCLSEGFSLTNESMDGDDFLWNICSDDLTSDPILSDIEDIAGVSGVIDSELVRDGDNWYGFFATAGINTKIFRMFFGTDLDNPPVINEVTITDSEGVFALLSGMDFIKNQSTWYGIAIRANGSKIILLNFGNSLANDAVAEEITIPAGVSISTPVDVDFVIGGTNYYAFVSNLTTGILSQFSFGTTVSSNPPAGSNIPVLGGSRLYGYDVTQYCGDFYGFGVSQGSLDYTQFKFGSSLDNSPLQEKLVLNEIGGASLASPRGVEIEFGKEEFYLFSGSISSVLYRVDIGPDITNTNVDLNEVGGDFSLSSITYGPDFVRHKSGFTGYVVNASNQSKKIILSENCGTNLESGEGQTLDGVSFSADGIKGIELFVTESNGDFGSVVKTVTVNPFAAPDIDFSAENSLCVTAPVTFVPQNTSGDIITYNWDLVQETSMLESPEITFNNAQVYNVTLDVANTNCSNSVQKQIEIFNEPIADFENPVGPICNGDVLNFVNNSTAPGVSGITSYLWDFNGEGSSTDEGPSFTFNVGGLKEITLTTTIPGCTNFISKSLNILEGPIADFSFDNVCLGDVADFTDLTTGPEIDPSGYMWNFGDGGTSTIINPNHTYNMPGDYDIMLTVSNANCQVSVTKTITVHAIPTASFVVDQTCVGPVQFTDVSTAELANITAWEWNFGNGTVSNEQNPIAQYGQNADFSVNLQATSNFGCSSDTTQTISILSAPTPNFSFTQGCVGEPTQFKDETVIADINPVTSYFWMIEGEVFSEANVEHAFTEPGTFTASMTLTTANGCIVVANQEIEIPALPIPNFTSTTACVSSMIIFEDQSVDVGDPIISRTWDFDGMGTANGAIAQFMFTEPGIYNIGLTTTSTLGCKSFVGKTIQVSEQPVADFVSSSIFGPPPLSVEFTNQSIGANSYNWLLNDSVDPFSSEENTSLDFAEEGDFDVFLIASNEFGCTDTLSQVIQVAFPATDLVLDEVIAVPNNGNINIVLQGANRGTLAIDGFDIVVDIEGESTIIESYEETLLKGMPFVHTLNFKLLEENNNISFLCVDLNLRDVDESNIDNNQGCINFESQLIIENPFPNPAVEEVRLNIILPDVQDKIRLTLMNIYGEVLIDESVEEVALGLNTFDFDVQSYESGLYLLRIRYDGTDEVRRIRKE